VVTCFVDKAQRLLDYETRDTLKQGLQEIIAYIRQRGARKFQYHLEIDNDKTPTTWKNKMF
jgi:UDP-glucose 4-epimerase